MENRIINKCVFSVVYVMHNHMTSKCVFCVGYDAMKDDQGREWGDDSLLFLY